MEDSFEKQQFIGCGKCREPLLVGADLHAHCINGCTVVPLVDIIERLLDGTVRHEKEILQ